MDLEDLVVKTKNLQKQEEKKYNLIILDREEDEEAEESNY